jgi:hypothetical protein
MSQPDGCGIQVENKMYTHENFKSKKALKEAVAAGKKVTYFQPGPFGGNEPLNGSFGLEGPHYPEPHKWYASAVAENGVIVKVK